MPGFDEIIGQEQIKEHFQNALKEEHISHAYILVGEKYSGKMMMASTFAAALLCDDEESRPCGKCHSCSQAATYNNPDIIYVTHEKPNLISVDDIREGINSDIMTRPYGGKRKIYIVDEAEKMNQQAQNALLKTFEEPPEYATILLLVTNLEELLPTIRSRAVTLNMKPVRDDLIKKYLMETVKIPDYRADICVAFARGNVGKAKLLSANEDFDTLKNTVLNVLKNIKNLEATELMAAVKSSGSYKATINDYLDIILVWYRDVLLYKATGNPNDLIFKEEIQYIRKVADSISFEGIEAIVEALDKAKRRITTNVNFELTMELLFLEMKERQM